MMHIHPLPPQDLHHTSSRGVRSFLELKVYQFLKRKWYTIPMLKHEIKKLLKDVLEKLAISVNGIVVDYPAVGSHGDYATNVALVAAKKAGKNPMELAEKIVEELSLKNKELELFNEIR